MLGVSFCEPTCAPNATVVVMNSWHNRGRGNTFARKQIVQNGRGKIPILFHKSDEHCDSAAFENEFYPRFELVLRQYRCGRKYAARSRGEVRVVPLGYMTNMFNGNKSTRYMGAPGHRNYVWAFAGNAQKSTDRKAMLRALNLTRPHLLHDTGVRKAGPLAAHQVHTLYRRAVFVPSPAGANLDCFRNSEAVIAGAVPVVVASKGAIENAFGPAATRPRFLYANSWPAAAVAMKQLLATPATLMTQQQILALWWQRQMKTSKMSVAHIAEKSY